MNGVDRQPGPVAGGHQPPVNRVAKMAVSTGGLGGAAAVLPWSTQRTMKKTRCKMDAASKAEIALQALRPDRGRRAREMPAARQQQGFAHERQRRDRNQDRGMER